MFVADFHIHSKYSRATSKDCVPEMLELWARRKGIDVLGTGDFTHPEWRRELREKLAPAEEGLYRLREEFVQEGETAHATRFLITGEISTIYKKNGKVRKVHNLILLPDLAAAERLSHRLEMDGNLHSDGRPILGMDSKDLLELTLEACAEAIFIPAHIWTPHFSVFGAYSGFDDISECFEDLTGHIHALETGLSSNPPMNWRLSALDRFTLVSNSDAHSPGNLAREANLFQTERSYPHIAQALREKGSGAFQGTLEFFPEEGKYHFNGHRNCRVCQSPADTADTKGICPACGGRVTVGVLQRVEELADREEGYMPPDAGHFESLIPLPEVLAASTGYSAKSIRGKMLYDRMIRELGPELHILREATLSDIGQIAGPAAAEGVRRLRAGEVQVSPGYDGAYGKVSILEPEEMEELSGQMELFPGMGRKRGPNSGKSVQKAPKKADSRQDVAAKSREPAKTDVLQGLNPEQEAAAFATAPVVAVAAGPGTGKTRTLAARIAWLVQEQGVPPSAITAVTFTNRAASEMRVRLERHFGNRRKVNHMRIGTFHSVALKQLEQAGVQGSVLDEATARSILKDVIAEEGASLSPGEALRRISLQKCGAAERSGTPALPDGLYDAYCRRLEEYGVMDYDDILLRALEASALGNTNPPAKKSRGGTWLLVDEFQDINPLQYRLIREWGRDARGIFVIGDPNQSIYGFRGSDDRCFDRLREDCPGMSQIALKSNYRSTPEILESASRVLGEGGASTVRAERESGAAVRLINTESPWREALHVARSINRMVGGVDMLGSDAMPSGDLIRGFSDIAVLYRTNRQAAVLEECLVREGIPCVVAGRDDFLTDPEVAGMLAFFRLLLYPQDLASLWTCLRELPSGPVQQAGAIFDRYRQSERTIEVLIAILRESAPKPFQRAFAEQLEAYGERVGTAKPSDLVRQWRGERGEEASLPTGKLLHMAVFHNSMEELLRTVALGQESDVQRYAGKRYTKDAVSLMTLHGAKGLEFPVVFLCGVTEGLIPHRAQTADPEEEGRLLYVGMTRAEDELILMNHGRPSPLLAEIPETLTRVETVVERQEMKQFNLFD